MVSWADLMDAAAVALADRPFPAEAARADGESLLTGVTCAIPNSFRRQFRLMAQDSESSTQVEPLIFQNDLPMHLLESDVVQVVADALANLPQGLVEMPGSGDAYPPDRLVAAIVISALSTFQLDEPHHDSVLALVRARAWEFSNTRWTDALDSLAARTAELFCLLAAASARRGSSWRLVTTQDQLMAEAVAAAVVGGTASGSGVPPQQWLFPFHLFCKVGLNAAQAALNAVERWLGIEFAPPPKTPDRAASLAVLVAGEAELLHSGCACKQGIDGSTVAYVPRGACRQADHDLTLWRPGLRKPGGSGLYAATLWGWQRRWLGGANVGSASGDGSAPGRSRLRPNDVAGSVLARRWLSADRGHGGPILLYDRILPEFCIHCQQKSEMEDLKTDAGPSQVTRHRCCEQPQFAYRCESTVRNGRRVLKPKLGLVVVPQDGRPEYGYHSTVPLGQLWVCNESGFYSLAPSRCPHCGPGHEPVHEPVRYGWVLLPLGDAWNRLRATAATPQVEGQPEGALVTDADLRCLESVFDEMRPGVRHIFNRPEDVWTQAKEFSSEELRLFRSRADRRALELLLLCKEFEGKDEANWNEHEGD
jgi:hypothetical protein